MIVVGLMETGLVNEIYSLGIEDHINLMDELTLKTKDYNLAMDVEKEIEEIKERLSGMQH